MSNVLPPVVEQRIVNLTTLVTQALDLVDGAVVDLAAIETLRDEIIAAIDAAEIDVAAAASSEAASALSEAAAAASETAAALSAVAAAASEAAAASSETNSAASEAASLASASAAAASEAAAANSETASSSSAVQAAASEAAAEADRILALQYRNEGETFRDENEVLYQNGQANTAYQNLEAISELLGITCLATCFADTTKDDNPNWVHQMAHTSWENEQLGTATRGTKRRFPKKALITAETNKITIWDMTGPVPEMWMICQTNNTSTTWLGTNASGFPVDIYYKNGVISIALGSSISPLYKGLTIVDFIEDAAIWRRKTNDIHVGTIAQRNDNTFTALGTNTLSDSAVNAVSMTLEDTSPFDRAGMRMPTIVANAGVTASAGGAANIIRPDGSVTLINTTAGAGGYQSDASAFDQDGRLVTVQSYNTAQTCVSVFDTLPTSDIVANTQYPEARNYRAGDSVFSVFGRTDGHPLFSKVCGANRNILLGLTNQLSVLRENPLSEDEGMVARVTEEVNTGMLVGENVLATLMSTTAETVSGVGGVIDHSVKQNHLTPVGSLTYSPVATGSQLMGLGGFSASEYVEQDYNSDLDFGTGDFYNWFWFNPDALSNRDVYCRSDGGASWSMGARMLTDGGMNALIGGATFGLLPSGTIVTSKWQMAVIFRKGGQLYASLDRVVHDPSASAQDVNMANATLRLGGSGNSSGLDRVFNGRLAMFRFGTTVPSEDQIRFAYEQEKHLFQENALATLQGTGAITGIAHEVRSRLSYVAQADGYTIMREGFIPIKFVAADCTNGIEVEDGVVVTLGASDVDVQGEAINLREELGDTDFTPHTTTFDFEFDGTEASKDLPLGYKPKRVWLDGVLEREGALNDYTVGFNGFRYSVIWDAAPANTSYAQVEAEAV